ncbi:MAG: hypothetical protein Q9207_000021 [Kuettlingeria erythrocarpa]
MPPDIYCRILARNPSSRTSNRPYRLRNHKRDFLQTGVKQWNIDSRETAFEHGSLTQTTEKAQSPALNQIEQSQERCGSIPSGNFGRIPHSTSVTDTSSVQNIYQNDFMAGTDPANSNLPDALAGQQFTHQFEQMNYTQQELPNQNFQQMCPDAWSDAGNIDLAPFSVNPNGSFLDSIGQSEINLAEFCLNSIGQSEIDLADPFSLAQPPPSWLGSIS